MTCHCKKQGGITASILSGAMQNATNLTLPLSAEALSVSFVYISIQVLGLCGNILVIFAICSSRRFKTNYYFLVFHLAACDIVLLLGGSILFIPHLMTSDVHILYTLASDITCPFINPLTEWIAVCEILFLIVIAVLRYQAVTQPLRPRLSRKRLRYITAAVYLIAGVAHIPAFLEVNQDFQCKSRWSSSTYYKIYKWSWEFTVTVLPPALLVSLYSKMCLALLRHKKNLKQFFSGGLSTGDQTTLAATNIALERNFRTLIISVIIVVQFFVAFIPARVIMFLQMSGMSMLQYTGWVMMLYFLGICCLNPLLYGLGDKALRAAYVRCFKMLCGRK